MSEPVSFFLPEDLIVETKYYKLQQQNFKVLGSGVNSSRAVAAVVYVLQ